MKKAVHEWLQAFPKTRVGVVGDVMLDVYVNGNVDRISPEAPVPIIHITSEDYVLGGAANVARNIVSLGGTAVLLGVIGNDTNGNLLTQEAQKIGINPDLLTVDTSRVTTEKRRIVSQSQQILRIDSESKNYLSKDIEDNFLKNLEVLINEVDIICVADYGKGSMTPRVIKYLITRAKELQKKVLVDAKPRNLLMYEHVDLLTPNRSEVLVATGKVDSTEGLRCLSAATHSPILMTCGADGMQLFVAGDLQHIPAKDVGVVDVSGAGDTVTALMALLRAHNVDYYSASMLAAVAASIAITKLKTAPVYANELQEALSGSL